MQAMTFRPCASAFAAFAPTKSLPSFSRLRLSECPSITHGMLMSASCSGAIWTTEDSAKASMRTQIVQRHGCGERKEDNLSHTLYAAGEAFSRCEYRCTHELAQP